MVEKKETKPQTSQDLKKQLIKLEKEFIRCTLQNSFTDSELFVGSRRHGLRLIRDLRHQIALQRGMKS